MNRVVLLDPDAQTVAFTQPGVRLDPGGIGKGWAIQRACDILIESGLRSALLHGGTSTVAALGAPEAHSPWQIAIAHPQAPETLWRTISLADGMALSVSAGIGQSFTIGDRAFGHIIDSRTGWPVDNSVAGAVVLSPSPTQSDALSTALLVLGQESARALSPAFPEAKLLLIAQQNKRSVR
jgi:FAD:protein FMN transferase